MAERLTTTQERAAHRLWCVRALRSRNLHGSLPDAKVRKKLTRDSGYGKGAAVWNDQRRRRRGLQGRPQKAAVVRGLLFEWFSVLRNSVAVRIPPKLVMVKAAQLVQDYVKECLLRGVPPDPPQITSHWMRGWTRQYRVSLRRPNGKPLSAKPLAEGAATYAHLMLSASSLWISDLASPRLVTVTSAASASSAPLESSSTCSCSVWTCSSAEVRRAFSFSAASSACEPRDSDCGAD